MIVDVSDAEDPNGEGTFDLVRVTLAGDEITKALLSTSGIPDDLVLSFSLPLGYAGQLGGKLLELAKEAEHA